MSDTRFTIIGIGLIFAGFVILGIFGSCYKLSVFMNLAIQAYKYAAEPIFFKNYKLKDLKKQISKQVGIVVIALSFFTGIISSFFGIGGGIIFVPMMIIVMGLAMKTAAPTSQFILLFASFSGLIAHSILGHPDFYQSLLLASGAFFGGLLGARLSLEIRERNLVILIVIVLIAASIKLFIDSLEALF